jgi:dTDP-4-amino-4,6-dideoxygalactose transaminase
MGCFSLGMAKLVATGQGGFVVTRDEKLFRQLRLIRNHGVRDNFTDAWYQWGFNFKFTDIQAAMGIAQLARAAGRIKHLNAIYAAYERGLSGLKGITMIPVKVSIGEVPLYVEVLVERRDELIKFLNDRSIQARPATPDLDPTPYFENQGAFPNSLVFCTKGIYLPGGPEQPLEDVATVIRALKEFCV